MHGLACHILTPLDACCRVSKGGFLECLVGQANQTLGTIWFDKDTDNELSCHQLNKLMDLQGIVVSCREVAKQSAN